MADEEKEKVHDIDVKDISVSHLNVRQHQRDAALQSLAASIKKETQLQPVLLLGAVDGPKPYKLIVGQRRFLAIRDILNKNGKHPKIKAIFLDRVVTDGEARRLSLTENLQRVPLNPADQMKAITSVFIACGRNVHKTAQQLGVSDPTIRSWVKLDEMATPRMKQLMKDRRLRPTDARRVILAACGDTKKADILADEIGMRVLPEKQRIVEYGKANPRASGQKILDEAAKPGKSKHIMLYLPDDIHGALKKAAKDMKAASDDVALAALTDWLTSKGYLV